MKLITPSYEIIPQTDLFKHIESCGRICYKSEDRITDDSCISFVNMIKSNKHLSVLEHGTIYLQRCVVHPNDDFWNWVNKYRSNPYSKVNVYDDRSGGTLFAYVTTNYRVITENHWEDDLMKYDLLSSWKTPSKYHEQRITVHFVCDRGIGNELVRHRVFSFSQESTRYCNYSKNKFRNELKFIRPNWEVNDDWMSQLEQTEKIYINLINEHRWKPEQARSVLPLCTKTEIMMTGFVSDWKKFLELRTSPQAHPQMRELCIPLQIDFITHHLI